MFNAFSFLFVVVMYVFLPHPNTVTGRKDALVSCDTQFALRILRNVATSSPASKSHYDVLGITPKATQTDIKSAYYKLSKIYHPDKSSDEESAKKFRAITEAYEVLGNIKLKKMYDKGLIVGKENTSRMGWQPEPEPTDPTLKFYKSRQHRHVTPTMSGRTPLYDFDSWSKSHYGDLFAKAKYEKEFVKKRQVKHQERAVAFRQETTLCIIIAAGIFMLVLFSVGEDYDADKINAINNADKLKNTKKKESIEISSNSLEINTPSTK